MKPLLLAPFLMLAWSACGDRAAVTPPPPAEPESMLDKAKGKAKDLASKVQGLEVVKTTLTKVKTQLAAVSDGASAQRAKTELQQLATSLEQQVDARGGMDELTRELGTAGDRLVEAAKQQLDKLTQDPQVQQALGPVLQQLRTVLGS